MVRTQVFWKVWTLSKWKKRQRTFKSYAEAKAFADDFKLMNDRRELIEIRVKDEDSDNN